MAEWYEIRGVEPGDDGVSVLLMSIPAEQWSADVERQVRTELTDRGVTGVKIAAVER